MISNTLPQETASYRDDLLKLSPNHVVHGGDWRPNNQSGYRVEVIKLLNNWGSQKYRQQDVARSVAVAATSFNSVTIEEPHGAGINVVIFNKPCVEIGLSSDVKCSTLNSGK